MPTSEAELKLKLAEKDAQVAALAAQVERLSREASPRRSPGSGPFSKLPQGIPPASPRAASPRGGSPRGRSPQISPRSGGTRPRSASPRGTRSPGSPQISAFGSTMKPRKVSPADFFHASMRGGPLTEPLPQRGLTERERVDPQSMIRGPSLLTRKRFGAKPSEWDRFRDQGGDGEMVNMMEDDNPFNDPFKYHPFKGMAFPPTDYIGPDDPRETDNMQSVSQGNALRLRFVYGYTSRKGCRSNLFYNKDGHIVYHTAALGIVYDKSNHEQWFFHGHDDDITALDMSPKDRLTIVTGQLGKDPKILVWSSRPARGSRHLPQLCIIHGDHKRAIIGLAFNRTGEFIASMGYDNNRSIALYKWKKDTPLEKMRIGVDKGHSDDVYNLAYNPVTDHAVAGGKKFLRFFGLKEGAMNDTEADARTAAKGGGSHEPSLSEHESKIWAKKGTFGSKLGAQDVMSLAFDGDGITYAGSGDGMIFRFAEQATDFMVKAHPLQGTSHYPPNTLCRVTAMWYDTSKDVLYSSGDDGWIHAWKTSTWDPRAAGHTPNPKPLKSFDLNQWVLAELKGTIVKMDDKELDKANPVRGRPAAAHAIHGDDMGNLIIGTVCNEIYELNMDDPKTAPMCYMQGHYDELWGLAMHPSKLEYCTGSEDQTLRVWDCESRTFTAMAKLDGPVRCACYSPNAEWIAVGMGGKSPSKLAGKWVVLDTKGLNVLYSPKHTRFERCADIKFSPNSHWIAVANADNGIDVYSCPSYGNSNNDFRQVAKLEGHSSFINHLDWSVDSRHLQTNCGAHELLYWSRSSGGRWAQEKSSSKMRDTEWSTQSCIYGWSVRGIWPEGADGTDINACGRSITGGRELLATSDDFGTVKLFRFPCIVPNSDCKTYTGHSSHVTNIAFAANDQWLVSTGGEDRGVFQWEVVREELGPK